MKFFYTNARQFAPDPAHLGQQNARFKVVRLGLGPGGSPQTLHNFPIDVNGCSWWSSTACVSLFCRSIPYFSSAIATNISLASARMVVFDDASSSAIRFLSSAVLSGCFVFGISVYFFTRVR